MRALAEKSLSEGRLMRIPTSIRGGQNPRLQILQREWSLSFAGLTMRLQTSVGAR